MCAPCADAGQPLAYCIVAEVSSTRLRGKTIGLARNMYSISGIWVRCDAHTDVQLALALLLKIRPIIVWQYVKVSVC